jgi:hypothetical protein
LASPSTSITRSLAGWLRLCIPGSIGENSGLTAGSPATASSV